MSHERKRVLRGLSSSSGLLTVLSGFESTEPSQGRALPLPSPLGLPSPTSDTVANLMAIATAAIEPTATFSATGRIHGTSKILLLRLFRCWPPSSNCLLSLPVVPLLLSPAEVGSFFWTAGQASRSLNFVLQPQNKAIILLKSKVHSFDMHLIVNLSRSSDDRPGALRLPKTSTSWSAPPFHCCSQCCWWQSCCCDSWCRCPDYCYC